MNITKERPITWHCIFCGKHGSRDDFQVPFSLYGKDKTMTTCPQCREYQGLEICDSETCDCWELGVVRELAEESKFDPDLEKKLRSGEGISDTEILQRLVDSSHPNESLKEIARKYLSKETYNDN